MNKSKTIRLILAQWIVNEFVIILLLLESSLWYKWQLFFIVHAISVFLSLTVLSKTVENNDFIGKDFKIILLILACLPLVGPISVLLFAFTLKYALVSSLAVEKYEIINQDYLEKNSKGIDESYYNLLNDKVIELIHGRQAYHDSLATLNLLEKLNWTPHKTRILQMLLEYSKYPSIIIGAASLINEKKDSIFNEIYTLTKQIQPDYLRLANLYHEIYYISLVDPYLSNFYLNQACKNIEVVLEIEEFVNLSTYNMGIRYFLENKQVERAEELLNQAMAIFPKKDYSSTFQTYLDEIAFLRK